MTLAGHLAELSEKHRLLETRIQEEMARPGADDLQISRMKKEKLSRARWNNLLAPFLTGIVGLARSSFGYYFVQATK